MIWAAKSVIQAMIKMAKESADAGFEKANWNVPKWEQTLVSLGEYADAEESVVENADQAASSKARRSNEGHVWWLLWAMKVWYKLERTFYTKLLFMVRFGCNSK